MSGGLTLIVLRSSFLHDFEFVSCEAPVIKKMKIKMTEVTSASQL